MRIQILTQNKSHERLHVWQIVDQDSVTNGKSFIEAMMLIELIILASIPK